MLQQGKAFYPMSDEKLITPEQCLGARAMLGLSRAELAAAAGVSAATLADFEAGKRKPYARTLADVQGALEERGIIFVAEDEVSSLGGAGLRFKGGGQ